MRIPIRSIEKKLEQKVYQELAPCDRVESRDRLKTLPPNQIIQLCDQLRGGIKNERI